MTFLVIIAVVALIAAGAWLIARAIEPKKKPAASKVEVKATASDPAKVEEIAKGISAEADKLKAEVIAADVAKSAEIEEVADKALEVKAEVKTPVVTNTPAPKRVKNVSRQTYSTRPSAQTSSDFVTPAVVGALIASSSNSEAKAETDTASVSSSDSSSVSDTSSSSSSSYSAPSYEAPSYSAPSYSSSSYDSGSYSSPSYDSGSSSSSGGFDGGSF